MPFKNPTAILLHAVLIAGLLFGPIFLRAQDTPRFRRDFFGDDTSRREGSRFRRSDDSTGRDTTRFRRGGGMSSLFSDTIKLNSNDYQLQIERTYVLLNAIDTKSELGPDIAGVRLKLADTDSVLAVLKDNIFNNTRALNLRNLQVFRTLLQNTQVDLRRYRALIDSSEKTVSPLKTTMRGLIGDTVLRQLLTDSVMRQQFGPQLRIMREQWRISTRHLRESLAALNLLQTEASSNSIETYQLLEKVESLLSSSADRIFSKAYNYIWERDVDSLTANAQSSFDKALDGEKKAIHYYFKDSGNKRLLLLLIGIIFFSWIYRNLRSLKKEKAVEQIGYLDLEYLPKRYIASAFVIMFSVAPLFDLNAPAAYIESMQFLLMVSLTVIFSRKWTGRLLIYWVAIAVMYIAFSYAHRIVDASFWERCLLIILNVLAIMFGIRLSSQMKTTLHLKHFLQIVITLHVVMNLAAILCNIFGRVSLAQILGNAAIFALTQAVGLAVFSKIAMEAILLQIATSRIRHKMSPNFDHRPIQQSFGKPILFLVVLLWLIVYTTNLNVYTLTVNELTEFLREPRHLGSAFFTIGGVLLFFMIIWLAHLLQKYVGYFFGDTGSDEEMQNKSQRSRLLIARLVVLCLGYLLAVTASGIPVDKITIVLGALGVGIGLGLQNIVSNFVSGIILIFDRPLQIGDLVEVGDKKGRVREIGLRSSTLMTKDGAEIIIPNGDILSRQITNWTLSHNYQRIEIDLSVAGINDMEVVASMVKKKILESKYTFEEREPQILFTKANDDGFDLKAFFWCSDVFKSEEAKSEVLMTLRKELAAEKVTISF